MDLGYVVLVVLGAVALLSIFRARGAVRGTRKHRVGYVYGLYTRAEGLRYIGKSVHPHRRYQEHRRAASAHSSKASNRWFWHAVQAGDTPYMRVLKKCGYGKQDYWEKRLIREALVDGVSLVNELLRGGM